MSAAADFTYDPTTPLGQIRLLIGDTSPEQMQFTDDDVTALMVLEPSSVYRAAAVALEQWAVRLLTQIGDVTLAGGQFQMRSSLAAKTLMETAKTYRELADTESGDMSGFFDIAEMVIDEFGVRERVLDQALRRAI